MIILLLVLLVLPGQEIHRPTGRVAPGTPAPTATPSPTPDPCAACPAPDSFTCQMWPLICYQCWEDCGHPIATPTPTPTATPPPPTATPTPQGPECILTTPSTGTYQLFASYLHEDEEEHGLRWVSKPKVTVPFGVTLRPCPCEGIPVGFRWVSSLIGTIKECGDTGTVFPFIFSDGFESGNLEAWNEH